MHLAHNSEMFYHCSCCVHVVCLYSHCHVMTVMIVCDDDDDDDDDVVA